MKKLLKFVLNGLLFMVLAFGALIYLDHRSGSKFEKKYEMFANNFILDFANNSVSSKEIIGKLEPARLDVLDIDGLKRVKENMPKAGNLEELLKVDFDGVTYSTEGNRGQFKFKVTFENVILLAIVEVVEKEEIPYVYEFGFKNVSTENNSTKKINETKI